jgi:hypothetical protein
VLSCTEVQASVGLSLTRTGIQKSVRFQLPANDRAMPVTPHSFLSFGRMNKMASGRGARKYSYGEF